KVGTANLTLSGTSTFTGPVNVNGGTVTLASTAILGTPTINLGGGTLNVSAVTGGYSANSTTLTGTGTVFGNVSHLGSALTPGTSGTAGSITFNNNYTANTGTFNIDLGSPGGLTLGGATGNDVIKVLG